MILNICQPINLFSLLKFGQYDFREGHIIIYLIKRPKTNKKIKKINTADHFYVKYPSSLGLCNKYIECIQVDTLLSRDGSNLPN